MSMRLPSKKIRALAAGRPAGVYSTKIIKAGALLADTRTLLAHWDESMSVDANLDRFRCQNLLGKVSRGRVADVLAIFRQRYLREAEVTRALAVLVRKRFPAASLDRVLYYHAAQADPLLCGVVLEILLPRKQQGITDVDVIDLQRELSKWVVQGRTTRKWSEPTTRRVAQGLLATLRDFGVLQGAVHKRIAPAYLSTEAFAYVMFYQKQHQRSGAKLLDLPDWQLFFLSHEGVERFLFEAHQKNLLEYHAAGTVTRLTFPARTLEEYANVLAERAH